MDEHGHHETEEQGHDEGDDRELPTTSRRCGQFRIGQRRAAVDHRPPRWAVEADCATPARHLGHRRTAAVDPRDAESDRADPHDRRRMEHPATRAVGVADPGISIGIDPQHRTPSADAGSPKCDVDVLAGADHMSTGG
jgi:hypothetical protein